MTIEKNLNFLDEPKWSNKKLSNIKISESFLRLSVKAEDNFLFTRFNNISYNLLNCGTELEFKQTIDNKQKLINANFCRLRMCPMCNWRRSKKIFSQVSKVVEELEKENKYEYIFLTLTCKNVQAYELKEQINILLNSFKKMIDKDKKIKKINLGYFRALEVTRNNKNNTYHPHLHIIFVVDKNYFKNKDYIKKKDFELIWQKYLNIDYIPVCDIRKIKRNNSKEVAELSKYAVKEQDLILETEEKTDENIKTLYFALHKKRLIGMGGLFKEYHKKLNLDDPDSENTNLVNTETETTDELTTNIILKYSWHIGYKNYILVKKS